MARALQNIADGESRRGRMRQQGGPRTIIAATLPMLAASAALAACGRGTTDADVARTAEAASPGTAYEVAVAQAEGAHRVAMERCGALAGSARQTCRDRAESELERARAEAMRVRRGHGNGAT